jgi:hypothetical protein
LRKPRAIRFLILTLREKGQPDETEKAAAHRHRVCRKFKAQDWKADTMKKVKAAAKGKPSADQPEEEYKPTPREQEAIKAFVASREARKLSSRLKVKKAASGAFTIGIDHKDPFTGQILLMQALGVTDFDFLAGIIGQVSNAGSKGREPSEEGANFMLSVMCGIEPKDQVEAMLAAQMAAVHMATMTFARRLANVETIPQQDSAERALNKLARTFTTQIEALKRYRSTGQQKVTVEHVTVQAGGQAIVGNVSHGTPANDPAQPPSGPLPVLAAPNEAPLPLPAGGGGVHEEKVHATS